MLTHGLAESVRWPGLIWGFDCRNDGATPVRDAELVDTADSPDAFRWLHLNLADQRSRRWLTEVAALPAGMAEMILSRDEHPRYLIDGSRVCGVLADLRQEFQGDESDVGAIRFVLAPRLMITARQHPVRCADVIRERLQSGPAPLVAPAAIEVLLSAMSEVHRATVAVMDETVQEMEDDLLRDRPPPGARAFLDVRSGMARLRRVLSGTRMLLHRLDDDPLLHPDLISSLTRFAARVSAMDGEVATIQNQLRQLRDDVELQANQRTNQNLYTLSILSALLLPATLVTGIFGMNTGGFPWASHPMGTLFAILVAVASSGAVYLGLRVFGFLKQ